MIPIVCPSCQQEHTVPPAMAGKIARCSCGARFQVPELPGGPAPAFSFLEPPRRGDDQARPEPEPWFFGVAVFFGHVILALTCVAFLALLVSLLYVSALLEPGSQAVLSAMGMVYMLLALLGLGFCSTAVLVLVDMGRSLREVRQRLRLQESRKE